MANISYTYKDCSPQDFEADESFREESFSERLEPVFDLGLGVERVNVVFSTGKGHRFVVAIDGIIKGRSHGTDEEGFEPSQVVRTAIKNFLHKMRELNAKNTVR